MRISDWSSDVCSSDLQGGMVAEPVAHGSQCRRQGGFGAKPRLQGAGLQQAVAQTAQIARATAIQAEPRQRAGEIGHALQRTTDIVAQPHTVEDRKSVVSGKSVSVRVDLGGRRIIQKKTNKDNNTSSNSIKTDTTVNITELIKVTHKTQK